MTLPFLSNKTWSDNVGGLITEGLTPEVPLYIGVEGIFVTRKELRCKFCNILTNFSISKHIALDDDEFQDLALFG